ncbi:argininosuccinate lyase [Anaerococcus hydrogenalis DSM 7454]|uniref:Argininosuccinate lyase n=1 Tax=Anaerococcus hydrogenalis DSM 7454 TaxID=561177 RepID=B6WB77_9FIRM|nr:argininosuccinate lyase [Anaerococcus hydrogenalis DSM 7454]
MAHFQRFKRDSEKFMELFKRLQENPLGACAMAGTTLPTDRFITTKLLGFDKPTENAMDTVGNRDNIMDYLYLSSLTMTHISSIAEEFVVFNSQEFSFIDIDDGYCTGSSIMPQKKNPDLAELARGKVGRNIGNLINLLTVVKGTFLTFNKDFQEDKEALFDSIKTLNMSLLIFEKMLEGSHFKEEVLKKHLEEGFIEATDIAEYLVKENIPFRSAHEIVGNLVKYCENNNKDFSQINKKDLEILEFPVKLDDLSIFKIENSIKRRNSFGATSFKEVERQVGVGEEYIEKLENQISRLKNTIDSLYANLEK